MTTSPERWATIERLYHAALARPADERAAFLADACAGDDGLRGEVESLLAQGASAEALLTRGAVVAAAGLVSDGGGSVLTGRRLGAYQILGPLGAGGMGEVYRARDTRLGRDVAIKILPRAFTADADRLARFEREARVLAALNHPHIAAIYGLEEGPPEAGPHKALVLELVEGETLAEHIARTGSKGLPLKEALEFARQIADALDAAHEKGIVHRDLKPANIKITPQGVVKVLDFGLAKLEAGGAGEAGRAAGEFTEAPTITVNDTREGLIVGTAAYMSPEQARGRSVDKRTDIWAFGCVLYEMFTGRAAFARDTVTDTLAAIVEREPNWNELPPLTPPSAIALLHRCLEKDPKRRLRDVGDARIELEGAPPPPAGTPSADRRDRLRTMLRWAAAIVAVAGLAVSAWYPGGASRTASVPATVTRLLVAPEAPLAAGSEGMVALSPDGRRLAYVATANGRQQIYIRDLTQFEGKALAGTEDGDSPAFSPDGQWLAFLADRRVKKISVAGGAPMTLFEFAEGLGLSWESNEAILFSPGRATGIWRVSAAGGTPTAVTTLHDGESSHRDPQSLPGSRALLYSALSGANNVQVFAESLETRQRHEIDRGAGARFLPTGHVVYTRDGTLFAVPFDPVRLEAIGNPVPLVDGVRQTPIGTPQTSFSQTGSMVYVAATAAEHRDETDLVWVTASGAEQPTSISGVGFQMPRLSPDANRVVIAASRGGAASIGTVGDLWMYDLARDTRSRLTFNGASSFPLWAPDGRRLAYSSGQTGQFQIHLKSLSGGTSEELLTSDRGTNYPLSWSRDGRYLASVSVDTKTFNDIWVIAVGNHQTWTAFVQTPFREGAPTFSHDGRWIAYASEQSGRSEVYMRPFPGPGEEWTISVDGGTEPVWAKNTGQLFYRHGDEMMVVDVNTAPTVTASKPRRLFEKPYIRSTGFWPNYDVAEDAQRFLMVKGRPEDLPAHINVVLNWQEELKQRVPTPPP